MLARWLTDLRFTLRHLLRTPGFSLAAVLALALGIGANTAIFSGVNALLLGPMPYSHPEQLVGLWEDASVFGFPHNNPAPADFFDWQRQATPFSGMAALRWSNANLTGSGRPEAVVGKGVTSNFFSVLGTQPFLGRTFSEDEDHLGAKVVVLSYALWQRRFGGDLHAIGKTLHMDNEPYTVIGIMPAGFAYPDRKFDYWRPAHFTSEEAATRDNHYIEAVGRLKPGISIDRAQADLSAIASRLERTYPDSNKRIGAVVIPLRKDLVGDTGLALLLLSCAAVLVLLIACANVANLLLIRGAERQREIAVRAALGASNSSLVFHLLTESLVLGVAGTLLGLMFAAAGMRILQLLIPGKLVNSITLSLDLPVLCFAIGVSTISIAIFGLLPALQSSRLDVNRSLKQGGRSLSGSSSQLQQIFVVSQVALALVLVTGAGLLVQTLSNLQNVAPGFPSHRLLMMTMPLSPQQYNTDSKRMDFYERVIAEVESVPGVQRAALSSNPPFTAEGNTHSFRIDGRAPSPQDQFNDALYRESSGHYLQTLGAHLMSGRLLDDADSPQSQPVVVINETFARQFWPHSNPLGDKLKFNRADPKSPWRTIVGVISDVKERGLRLESKPAMYVPFTQVNQPDGDYLVVRTAVNPASVVNSIRAAIARVDPEQPVAQVSTMDETIELGIREHAEQTRVLSIFAGLALFLAALGIYGVLAYSVAQRRKEIGVRIALGADALNVTGLVLKQGMLLTGFGLLLGLGLALAFTRAMQGLLFGVAPLDPVSFSSSLLILLAASLAACLLPAVNASRVDPIVALREE